MDSCYENNLKLVNSVLRIILRYNIYVSNLPVSVNGASLQSMAVIGVVGCIEDIVIVKIVFVVVIRVSLVFRICFDIRQKMSCIGFSHAGLRTWVFMTGLMG